MSKSIPATVTLAGVTFNVTAVGASAFRNSSGLTSTLQTLGGMAFHNDAALIGIKCKATTPPDCHQ